MPAVPKPKKKKTKSIKTLRNKADKLLQQWGRKEYSGCFVCNSPEFCLHHVITKSSSAALRYDPANLLPLCNKHHCLIHKQPALITAQITVRLGKKWVDYLSKNKFNPNLKTNKGYYQAIIADLEEKLKKGSSDE